MPSTQRTPFREVSNNTKLKKSPPLLSSPKLSDFWGSSPAERPRKRQRVVFDEDQENQRVDKPVFDKSKGKEKEVVVEEAKEDEELPRRRAVLSNNARLNAMMMSSRRLPFQRPSTLPVLQSLVSSHGHDVFRIHSTSADTTFDLPVCCSYSHSAKKGGTSLLAVSTEDGKVEIINTARRGEWDLEPTRTSISAHPNAVFDVRWSEDDSHLATASGDSTCSVMDIQTSTVLAQLSGGHSSTVKQVQWSPFNPSILSSASRDGSICVWDLRETQHKDDEGATVYKPVTTIFHAHADEKKKGKTTKSGRPGVRSITSILYNQHREDLLYSSSSANGIIKLWDLRQPRTSFESSSDSTTLNSGPKRGRGICSMVFDHTGSTIYAVAADSRVHTYSATTLTASSPDPLGDERMRVGSFYVRAAVSPCGEYLASGSTGGQLFVWSLRDSQAGAVVLDAGGGKEVAVVDWGHDGALAATSDDRTVRVWRPDVGKARWCRENAEEAKWDWAVASM